MTRPDCLECFLYHCKLCQGGGPGTPSFAPRDAYDQNSPRAVEDVGPYRKNDSEERQT